MQNIDKKEVQAEALEVAEGDERLNWERPILRRVGASQAEYNYSYAGNDGMYFS